MPLTLIDCCKGQACTPQECLDHAATRENSCPFTYELLSAIYGTIQNRDYISTTALTSSCKRSLYLERTEDFTSKPERFYAAFRGTMFHGQLEAHVKPDCIAEARYFADVPDVGPLSCSPDLVDIPAGIMYDYKTTKEVPRFDYVWPNHNQQLNVNRWVVDHAHTVQHNNKKYDLSSPTVRRRFVPIDWQELIVVYLDNNGPKPIKVTRSEQVPKKSGPGTKSARVPDIWSDEQAVTWITQRYREIATALEAKVLPPIPPGFENQSHGLCGYCDNRAKCREYEMRDLLKEVA